LVHVEEDAGRLQVFVPRNSEERQKCYSGQLPKALTSYLGIRDPTAVDKFFLVFWVPEHILDSALDERGIVQLPDTDLSAFDLDEPEQPGSAEVTQDTIPFTSAFSHQQSQTPHQGPSRTTSSTHRGMQFGQGRVGTNDENGFAPSVVSVESGALVPPATPGSRSPIYTPRTQQDEYLRVLENVIEAAHRAVFPSAESLNSRDTTDARLSVDSIQGTPFGIRSQSQIAHDIKIGAAGELFVSLHVACCALSL
jgi:hypothetical protein